MNRADVVAAITELENANPTSIYARHALFATGDHIDRQAWEDLTHNYLEQARSVVYALDHIGWRCGDPTGTLRDALDGWTAGLEAAEAAWQDDRRRDLAWAGKAWAE